MSLSELSSGLADLVEAASPSLLTILGRHVNATATVWADGGLLVTANHNLPRGEQPLLRLHDGAERAARVLGRDPATDLALLQLAGLELPVPSWSDDAPRVGELVVAVGRSGASARATLGAVTDVRGPWTTPWGGRVDAWLNVDGSLPRGFSGGPLLAADGRALGVNTRSLVRGGTTLPTATLKRVLGALEAEGRVRRGWLGVGVSDTLVVTELSRGGPAVTAGVRLGDRITSLAGEALSSPGELLGALGRVVEQEVSLGVEREGEALELSVTVAELKARRGRRCG